MRPAILPLLISQLFSPSFAIRPDSIPAGGTFTRGTLATQVNADGTIGWCPHNHILNSNDLSTTGWSSSGAGGASYSGGKIIDTTTTGTHGRNGVYTMLNGQYSFQVKLAAAEYSKAILDFSDQISGDASATFDLSAGTFSAVTAAGSWTNASATISNAGGGYWLCTLTATKGAGTVVAPIIYLVNNAGTSSFAGTGSSGIYAKEAQLNTGPAQPYYATSGGAYYGLRVADYGDDSTRAGIKLEMQSTNTLTQSQPYSTVTISVSTSDIVNIGIVALPLCTCTSNQGRIETNSIPNGQTIAATAFLKRGTSRFAGIGVYTAAGVNLFALVDFDSGNTITGGASAGYAHTASIKLFANGVYRLTWIVTNSSGSTSATGVKFGLPSSVSSNIDSGTVSDSVYMGGMQLEVSPVATSLIPAFGASVTRGADIFTYPATGISGWNLLQGSWFIDYISAGAKTTAQKLVYGSNVCEFMTERDYMSNIGIGSWNGASENNSSGPTTPIGQRRKACASYGPFGNRITQSGRIPSTIVGATYQLSSVGSVTFSGMCGTLYQLWYSPRSISADAMVKITS